MHFIFNFYNVYLFKNKMHPGKGDRSEDIIIVYNKYLRNRELCLLTGLLDYFFKITINNGAEKFDVTKRSVPTT